MNLQTIARNAGLDAITALANGGTLKFHTSAHGVVCSLPLSATAFAAASGGSAAANSITTATCSAGTVDHAHLCKSDGTEIMQLTVGTSGAEINLSQLTYSAGDQIGMSSLSLSLPAS